MNLDHTFPSYVFDIRKQGFTVYTHSTSQLLLEWSNEEDEMGETCGKYKKGKNIIEGFGRKATTWET